MQHCCDEDVHQKIHFVEGRVVYFLREGDEQFRMNDTLIKKDQTSSNQLVKEAPAQPNVSK